MRNLRAYSPLLLKVANATARAAGLLSATKLYMYPKCLDIALKISSLPKERSLPLMEVNSTCWGMKKADAY